MERQEIRYHPLIDGDTEGTEKYRFLLPQIQREFVPCTYQK